MFIPEHFASPPLYGNHSLNIWTISPIKKLGSFKFQNSNRHQLLSPLLSFAVNSCCYWLIRRCCRLLLLLLLISVDADSFWQYYCCCLYLLWVFITIVFEDFSKLSLLLMISKTFISTSLTNSKILIVSKMEYLTLCTKVWFDWHFQRRHE